MARKPKAPVPVTDEMLVALADGEMPAAEAKALRARIADDPALAARFAAFVETRHLLAPAPAAAEAVPPALEAAIRRMAAASTAGRSTAAAPASTATAPAPAATAASAAVPVAAERQPAEAATAADPAPASPSAGRPMLGVITGGRASASAAPARKPLPFGLPLPLAAALVFGVGGAFGALVTRVEPPTVAQVLASPEGASTLTRALATLPSGETARFATRNGIEGRITVVGSYRLADGRLCREYETRFTGAVTGREIAAACRGSGTGAFAPVIAVTEPPAADGSYAPASGGAAAVEEHLRSLGAGTALDPAAERASLRR